MRLLSFFAFLATCAILLNACRKEDKGDGYYHCQAYALKVPVNIGFVGFSLSELDTITVNTFQTGSNFSGHFSTTKFTNTSMKLSRDTAQGSFQLFPGDYEILLPATGASYRIWDFHTRPAVVEYTNNIPCNSLNNGHPPPFYQTVDSVVVDGTMIHARAVNYGISSFYLHR
jgi:hypothetical protein